MFRPGTFPNVSATGDMARRRALHADRLAGDDPCRLRLASSATTDYFVCRYSPTGNKDGLFMAATRQLAQGGN